MLVVLDVLVRLLCVFRCYYQSLIKESSVRLLSFRVTAFRRHTGETFLRKMQRLLSVIASGGGRVITPALEGRVCASVRVAVNVSAFCGVT